MTTTALDLVAGFGAPPVSAAVVPPGGGALSYGELADLVGQAGTALRHNDKALVLCAGDRDLPTVLAYLAALRLGHTVAFLPATAEVLSAYRPDFVVPAPGAHDDLTAAGYRPTDGSPVGTTTFRRASAGPHAPISDETALLLTTSGTTGTPKAVRLSYSAIADNSRAIVDVLGITAAERAATTLPITHAYGLSVLNSHLIAGASVVLSDSPPLALATWDRLARTGVTSLAAVPTTYAAFGPSHVSLLGRTAIRTMTQAGARLADELTTRLARMMQRRGGRFFTMYGQTEATSRMAVLDPADLPERLGSVGRAVPGGVFTIAPGAPHARAVPGEGAVRYRGPGVMLGYASRREDLARGAEVDQLDTGDLGYLSDGYLYLTGRTKRIAKVLGVRTSLDDLERAVERPGHPTAVLAGDDDVVYLVGAGDAAVHEQQRRHLADSLGVPSRHVVLRQVDRLPRTPGGKVDYRALAEVIGRSGGGAEQLASTVRPGT
ncbi:AMP-binding protein [Actinosynnema sp. CA-299493]